MISHPIILVIEDDESIANLIKINLDLTGFKTILAGDGDIAVQLFDTNSVSLVLLDLMLPGKDGWEVLEHIKAKGNGKIPVIVTSAKTQRSDDALPICMGIVDYVTKPFDPYDLIQRIKGILS
ncbi:MAG: response regulator transcription factor [Firmicutes bacterium]|nr:response regulator transcription factor [Bacillota bacterium]